MYVIDFPIKSEVIFFLVVEGKIDYSIRTKKNYCVIKFNQV